MQTHSVKVINRCLSHARGFMVIPVILILTLGCASTCVRSVMGMKWNCGGGEIARKVWSRMWYVWLGEQVEYVCFPVPVEISNELRP